MIEEVSAIGSSSPSGRPNVKNNSEIYKVYSHEIPSLAYPSITEDQIQQWTVHDEKLQ